MSHSIRIIAVRISVLLFSMIAAPLLRAQTLSADSGHWLNCDVVQLVDDHQSGPNFTVHVSFRGQPIVGVKVVLTGGSVDREHVTGSLIGTAETDSTGTAHFFAIPPGTYWAHVDKALLAESKRIQVQPDNPSEENVDIEWPASPMLTRNLQGRIFSWQKSTPQNRADLLPHRSVFVQLLDLRSGKPLMSVLTDSRGHYEFPEYPDGLYVMRVGEHEDPSINSYDKAIAVSTDSVQEHMPDLEIDQVCGKGLLEMADQPGRENKPSTQIAVSSDAIEAK
jgi:hypothetical protein